MSTVKNEGLRKTMATEVATASNEMAATPDTGVSKTIKRFCLFELHEYMDMYPTKEVRMYEGKDEADIARQAQEFAKYMTEVYSGGPTRFIKVMSAKDAQLYVQNVVIWDEKRFKDDDMEANINRAVNMYNESYPEAPHTFDV